MADAEHPGSQQPPHPTDNLTADRPIAPPDHLESPREESITRSKPHLGLEEDNDAFNEFSYPGETLDLTRAHEMGEEDYGKEHASRALTAGSPPLSEQEPVKPVPWYSATAALGLLLWGGMYLGTYSGGFQGDVFKETPNYKMTAEAPADPKDPKVMRAAGQKLFTVNCVQCHQASGLGQAGQFPPLVASEWVVGDAPKRLTQILLHGIQGAIHVKGESYNNNMPAWNTLTDKQIASILTYIRSEWGNSAPPIAEADLVAARQETASRNEPWSEAELLKIPAGPLDGQGAGGQPPATGPAAAANGNPPSTGAGNVKPPAAPLGQGPAPNPAATP